MHTFKYGFGTPVDGSFKCTVDQVVEALQSQGFGELTFPRSNSLST